MSQNQPTPFPNNENVVKEWDAARDLLGKIDEHTHDLRKIGFTFITALLAAQPLLLTSSQSTTALSNPIKLAVILVTLLLIITVRLFEKSYELFQKGARIRASILERRLNLELLETTYDRSQTRLVQFFVTFTYISFAAGAFIVGYFILLPAYAFPTFLTLVFKLLRLQLLWAAFFGAVASLVAISYFPLGIRHRHGGVPVDWTLDRVDCVKGDYVRLTVTNLDYKRSITLAANSLAWTIRSQDAAWTYPQRVDTPITIGPQENHTWIWGTDIVPKVPEIYTVVLEEPQQTRFAHLIVGKKEVANTKNLRRKISVYPKNAAKPTVRLTEKMP